MGGKGQSVRRLGTSWHIATKRVHSVAEGEIFYQFDQIKVNPGEGGGTSKGCGFDQKMKFCVKFQYICKYLKIGTNLQDNPPPPITLLI